MQRFYEGPTRRKVSRDIRRGIDLMDDSHLPKERFELSLRGKVSERLEALWKSRNAELHEAALDDISEALDQTRPHDDDEEAWFKAARNFLRL